MKTALPLSKMKFTVTDFYCIDTDTDFNNMESIVLNKFKSAEIFDCELLITLLFTYIKKKIDIIDFINNAKRIHPNFKMSRIRLLEYILSLSDTDLKTLIILSTSMYSACPLLSKSLEQR